MKTLVKNILKLAVNSPTRAEIFQYAKRVGWNQVEVVKAIREAKKLGMTQHHHFGGA